jgi:murein DD-endopeptidase MepM/ murein hydrolase activator NlpD
MRRWLPIAVVLLVALPVIPVGAEVTPAEVDTARQELREVSDMLQSQTARYDDAVAREAVLRDRLDRMLVELTVRERDLDLARRDALDHAAEMYMTAGATRSAMVSVADFGAFPARLVYYDSVATTDRQAVNTLEASRRDYEQQRELVDASLAEQAGLIVEMEALIDEIYTRLEEANDRYQTVKSAWDAQEAERIRLEEEERRRQELLAQATTTTTPPSGGTPPTTVAPPPAAPSQPPGTRVCPVDGAHSFTDTWGAPRSGGRTHTGQDLMAPNGTPLVAIEAGQVYQVNWHGSGGNQLYILGDSGGLWFYAHMASPAIVSTGSRVEAGQRVGYVGATGNASTPHLHFGWYPGGSLFGALANPYSILVSVC